jgi:8-oxo-dGTP pyrophosphatase MutT (NUDIX family)
MNKNNICNNCGKNGHLFHECKLPITSYGIVLFRHHENKIQYLMIRRKDSFGYIDFIRGKYSPFCLEQIEKCVEEMSLLEKERIVNESFDKLWKLLWGENNIHQYKSEELTSAKKFEMVRNGLLVDDNVFIKLTDIVLLSKTNWEETEWEFPKGRRNYQEKDLECALREFEEETGFSRNDIVVVDNVLPFEEIYIGSNYKSYKHKYYVAFMNQKQENDMQQFQKTEVSKLEWKTFEECLESIRPYNLEKKNIIIKINKMLEEYRLYL